MKELNVLTLNGEQYEIADKVARQSGGGGESFPESKTGLIVSANNINLNDPGLSCNIIGGPEDKTSVDVYVCGKNIFDIATVNDYYDEPDSAYSYSKMDVKIEGTRISAISLSCGNTRFIRKTKYPCGTYRFSAGGTNCQ